MTGRACWSLGNAHAAMGNHEKALHYAQRHLEISREVCPLHLGFYRNDRTVILVLFVCFLLLISVIRSEIQRVKPLPR